MRIFSIKRIVLYFGILIFMVACVPEQQSSPEASMSTDRLMRRLESNRRNIKTFRGTGSITVRTDALNATSNIEVLVKKPDSIKVSLFGPFGIDLAQILIANNNFQYFDVMNNRLYYGKVKKGIIKKLLKIDIDLEDLANGLVGSINFSDKLQLTPDRFEVTDDIFTFVYEDPITKKQELYVANKGNLAIREYRITNQKGENILEGNYSLFREFSSVQLPSKIDLNYPISDQRLKVEYRTMTVNNELPDLTIKLPDDVERIEWK
ncbi:MAG: DUF4292 domain-containing protein [Melioribacteraceae bacterium]